MDSEMKTALIFLGIIFSGLLAFGTAATLVVFGLVLIGKAIGL